MYRLVYDGTLYFLQEKVSDGGQWRTLPLIRFDQLPENEQLEIRDYINEPKKLSRRSR
jgi:hypothetical protein